MIRLILQKISTLQSTIPYFPNRGMPSALKKLWFKNLLKSKPYLLAYLISISIWKIYFFLKICLSKNFLNRPISKKQKLSLLRLSIVEQIHPVYYFFHNFEDKVQSSQRHHFLYHRNLNHCISQLSKNVSNTHLLNDKHAFFLFCKKNEIPTPTIYATISNKQITNSSSKNWKELSEFIIKSREGSQGKGFDRFILHQGKNAYYSEKDQRYIPLAMMDDFLLYQSQKHQAIIIQELLKNHPSFSNLCNHALATVRILSLVNKNGQIKLFRPIIQLPQGESILNYTHSGAIYVEVDLKTGKIGEPINKIAYFNATFTKARNIQLPFWEETIKQVFKLHQLLIDIPFIGWDIALTTDGPKFLEGNLSPWLDVHQKKPYTPFIPTTFYQQFLTKYSVN